MKPTKISTILHPLVALLLGSATLLVSCQRDEYEQLPGTSGGSGSSNGSTTSGLCTILPPRVTIEPFGSGSNPATRGAAPAQERLLAASDDAVTTLTFGSTSDASTRAAENLADGVYYRILIYTEENWNTANSKVMKPIEQRLCKVGSNDYFDTGGNVVAKPLTLPVGEYHMFCYSYNTTAPFAEFTVDTSQQYNSGNIVTGRPGDDLLITANNLSFTIATANLGKNFPLPDIAFTHRMCKLTATLAADGFADSNLILADPAPTLTLTSDKFYAYMELRLPALLLMSAGGNGTLTINLERSADGKTYSGSLYVVPASDATITATYSFKPDGATEVVSTANKPLTAAAYNYAKGTEIKFTIQAVPVYLLATTPPEIGTATWALSNLKKDNTLQSETTPWVSGLWDGTTDPNTLGYDRIYFNTTTPNCLALNDYWNWGQADPEAQYPTSTTIADNKWSTSLDPCRKVSGGGWMLPTKEHLDGLYAKRLINKWVKVNGTAVKTDSRGYTPAVGARAGGVVFAAKQKEALFLPAVGFRDGSSSSDFDRVGYWSSTLSFSFGDTYYGYMLGVGQYGSADDEFKVDADSGNMGYTLRCVKNPNPDADVTPPGGITDGGWTGSGSGNAETPIE